MHKQFRYTIKFEEVEKAISFLKGNKINISKKEIQRQLPCDHKAIKNNQKINDFIEDEIRKQEQSKRQLLIETIEKIKTTQADLSIEAVIQKTSLSKKFIEKKENKNLIDKEIAELEKIKKQRVVDATLDLKNNLVYLENI